MTDFTPKQLEWAARLLCASQGVNADALSEWPDFHFVWEHELPQARRLLAELKRQGVKATSREHLWYGQWGALHDTASICPDAER